MNIDSQQAGFTLIELMIASAIFIVVTVSGVSVLLQATNNYRTTSQIRQSMDTLAYVMEDMTRSIRLGTVFHCATLTSVEIATPCPVNTSTTPGQLGGYFLSFEAYNGNPGDPNDQVMYWMYAPSGDVTKGVLYKKNQLTLGVPSNFTPDPALFSQITPESVYIDMTRSGFSVSTPGSAAETSAVTVRLAGKVTYHNTDIPFDIQSTIAPRNIPSLQ